MSLSCTAYQCGTLIVLFKKTLEEKNPKKFQLLRIQPFNRVIKLVYFIRSFLLRFRTKHFIPKLKSNQIKNQVQSIVQTLSTNEHQFIAVANNDFQLFISIGLTAPQLGSLVPHTCVELFSRYTLSTKTFLCVMLQNIIYCFAPCGL